MTTTTTTKATTVRIAGRGKTKDRQRRPSSKSKSKSNEPPPRNGPPRRRRRGSSAAAATAAATAAPFLLLAFCLLAILGSLTTAPAPVSAAFAAAATSSADDDSPNKVSSGEEEDGVVVGVGVGVGVGGGGRGGVADIAERGSSSSSSAAASISSSARSTSSSNSNSNSNLLLGDPALGSDSVVLITGAAGFVGSELALALRRTYRVKKLLLVDDLGVVSENESAYVPPSPNNDDKNGNGGRTAIYEKLDQDGMGGFEIRRQRAFRILHELTAAKFHDDDDDDGEGEGGNGGGAESVRFYRADMRPSIPEFFDFGEVPLLEGIFQSHPDITHVVHLADVPPSAQNQAIPRNKDSVKTGRMEGLLEEMRLMIERASSGDDGDGGVRLPQFVYASSHEVYDRISTADGANNAPPRQPNPPPFREDGPITTPSSLHGTAKLIDEVLASAYHSTHGIYSVGLRFFPIYGPWNSGGTEVFDMAERVSLLNEGTVAEEELRAVYEGDANDYVFIDDAVDAVLSAMQYRPPGGDPPPVVFNVGTGRASTLGEVRDIMAGHYPKLAVNGKGQAAAARRAREDRAFADRRATRSVASTSRSESLLGFRARVSLKEGLARTLSWHNDRAYPYGRDPSAEESFERRASARASSESLAGARGEECSPLDRECLRGAPVYPCASECRREGRCTPSAWDDVAALSEAVTSGCDAVLFTVLLDDDAEQIPSAAAAVGEGEETAPYVGAGLPEDVGRRTQARCNIAFVSDRSPLVRRLRSEGEEYLDEEEEGDGLPPLLRHGFWTVLPVSTPSASDPGAWMHAFDGTFALEYLPKVSPGRFFGSSVRIAAYAEPNVLIGNLPGLLKRMEDGPPVKGGSTVLVLAKKRQGCDPARRGSDCPWTRPAMNDSVQSTAYNMIRVALRGDVLGGGLDPAVDTSVVLHSLRREDSRLMRCDIYGEAAQWGAGSDERALEFIVSLHDLWSRALLHWSEQRPWWIGGGGSEQGGGGVGGDGLNEDAKDEALEKEGGGSVQRRLEGRGTLMEDRSGMWMGILSSKESQLFVNILPSEVMGIIHLDG